MKKTAIIAGIGLLFAVGKASAQEVRPVPTVDSIAAKYQLMEMPKPLTLEQIYPVLGQFVVTNEVDQAEVGMISITLDEQNKGMVWIEGMPQGRFYAQLRKSPATYKIPAQKNEEGKDIPEGTLYFDEVNKVLNISIGRAYNLADPLAVFIVADSDNAQLVEVKAKGNKTKLKTTAKTKHIMYSGSKQEQTTVKN